MSEKLDRIGADRAKALKKREEWDAKYKELDRKYREQENTEIQTITHAHNLTPDQLARIIELAMSGQVGAYPADMEPEDTDAENDAEEGDEQYEA